MWCCLWKKFFRLGRHLQLFWIIRRKRCSFWWFFRGLSILCRFLLLIVLPILGQGHLLWWLGRGLGGLGLLILRPWIRGYLLQQIFVCFEGNLSDFQKVFAEFAYMLWLELLIFLLLLCFGLKVFCCKNLLFVGRMFLLMRCRGIFELLGRFFLWGCWRLWKLLRRFGGFPVDLYWKIGFFLLLSFKIVKNRRKIIYFFDFYL